MSFVETIEVKVASNEIVLLDVGGTLFKTTVGTLTTNDAPNFFTSQLSGLIGLPDTVLCLIDVFVRAMAITTRYRWCYSFVY
jgi:hypothetical protein